MVLALRRPRNSGHCSGFLIGVGVLTRRNTAVVHIRGRAACGNGRAGTAAGEVAVSGGAVVLAPDRRAIRDHETSLLARRAGVVARHPGRHRMVWRLLQALLFAAEIPRTVGEYLGAGGPGHP